MTRWLNSSHRNRGGTMVAENRPVTPQMRVPELRHVA
jgi:hypothetical protein